ncbi:MAG: ATP-binding protein, partial [Pricia sp.]
YVQQRNVALEKEMEQLREDMRNISEEQEAYNEELQSANEELLSSNEEMQSLNEELETSKEELQSTNEELIVVNRELIEKQEELNDNLDYLDDIIATMREPFLVLDRNFHILKANTAYYRKFEVEDLQIEGKPFFHIHKGLWNKDILHGLLQRVLPEKENLQDREIVFDLKSDGERTFLFNARRVVREKKSDELILLSITDITREKEVEGNYLTTIEELNRTNEQLEQFVHVASHDLQEPLRKISTFATRITESNGKIPQGRLETYLQKITASSARMSALIKNMLNYARLTNHEQLFEPTNVSEVFEDLLSDFELLIEQKEAKLDIGPMPTLEAIPLQINQLFYNLVSNALKFTKDGVAPIVRISSHRLSKEEIEEHPSLDPDRSYYQLDVQDNGIGFGEKYKQQIFTIFQRLNPSSQYLGTGIGLALCKQIAENHHGTIFANSKEGQGAAFHIILPAKQPD